MHTRISDVPIKPIRVKSEAKLSSCSRTLLRQPSMSNSSNEVYYADSSAGIPFRWESRPGTPKVKLSERERRPLPPLTPPPSYLCSPARISVKKHPSEAPTPTTANPSSILQTVLPKLNVIKKSNAQSSPSSSSSSSSSSPWSSSRSVRSSPFTPKPAGGKQRRKLSFHSWRKDVEGDEDEGYVFHVSSLCFGGVGGRCSSNSVTPSRGSANLLNLLLKESA